MTQFGFNRVGAGRIAVDLHPWMLNFVDDAAQNLVHLAERPEDPAYSRICGPINVAVDYDDPLVILERQMAIDSLCTSVRESIALDELTDDQAEAWLQVLSMTMAMLASRFAIVDEDYAESLDEDQRAVVALTQALQWGLVEALEATV
jgi:hypothetical protein